LPDVAIGGDGVLQLLFTGGYPAVTWMPFVFAGMALGRLDLTAVAKGAVSTSSATRMPCTRRAAATSSKAGRNVDGQDSAV
jgi:hypothetical protein